MRGDGKPHFYDASSQGEIYTFTKKVEHVIFSFNNLFVVIVLSAWDADGLLRWEQQWNGSNKT